MSVVERGLPGAGWIQISSATVSDLHWPSRGNGPQAARMIRGFGDADARRQTTVFADRVRCLEDLRQAPGDAYSRSPHQSGIASKTGFGRVPQRLPLLTARLSSLWSTGVPRPVIMSPTFVTTFGPRHSVAPASCGRAKQRGTGCKRGAVQRSGGLPMSSQPSSAANWPRR